MNEATADARHGISIGIERTGSNFFLMLKAVGKLTHDDYELISPMIDAALGEVNEPRVRAFIDGTELEGWEPRAAWDDFSTRSSKRIRSTGRSSRVGSNTLASTLRRRSMDAATAWVTRSSKRWPRSR